MGNEVGLPDSSVVHEWRVTGEPGDGYPSYEFIYRSDRIDWPGDEAERKARAFVTLYFGEWTDGPYLQHRTVAYSPWEPADG